MSVGIDRVSPAATDPAGPQFVTNPTAQAIGRVGLDYLDTAITAANMYCIHCPHCFTIIKINIYVTSILYLDVDLWMHLIKKISGFRNILITSNTQYNVI